MPIVLRNMDWIQRQRLIALLNDFHDETNDFPLNKYEMLTLQSADVETFEIGGTNDTEDTTTTTQKLLTFHDANSGNSYSNMGYPDPSNFDDYMPTAELGDFLKRPVRIASYTWNDGGALIYNLYPWYAYLSDTSVANKIKNYAFIRANLHLKVVVNASPFYYGAAMLCYQPMPSFTPSTITSAYSSGNIVLNPLSQRPHIKISPQTCEGGELVAPFLWHKDWADLTSAQEIRDLGRYDLVSITNLYNANSVSTTGCTITVFAWLDDVYLSGPSAALVLQAKDEYGPVSGVASTIAKFSNSLSSVPYIGPYARATSMVASGVGSIASLLGFTNVPNISDTDSMKPHAFHALASSQISTPVDKMSLDPKNELSIDSRTVGLDGKDDLLISSLVERETYIDQAAWTGAQTPDTTLWVSAGTPDLTNVAVAGSVTTLAKTPMALLATMFQYWRGDIVIRVKIVKSKFHAGRLVMQWDPKQDNSSNPGLFNQVITRIVDIMEEDDIEFVIPYHQTTHYLHTAQYENNSNNGQYFGSSIVYSPNYQNGVFTIKVLTAQTSPVASADIVLLMYARGGTNFEFMGPMSIAQNTSVYTLQSGEEERVYEDGTNLVFGGERIVSIRQLLRRSSLNRVWALDNLGGANFISNYTLGHSFQPLYRGFDPNGVNTAQGILTPTTTYAYNFALNTPYGRIAPCFVGYRGSHIWHYNVNSLNPIKHLRALRTTRGLGGIGGYESIAGVADSGATPSKFCALVTSMNSGSGGESLTNQLTQSGLSVLYPMYSQYRMRTTAPTNATLGTSKDDTNLDAASLEIQFQTDNISNIGKYTMIEYHHSIGTDFNLFFFLNVPSLYVQGDPTPV